MVDKNRDLNLDELTDVIGGVDIQAVANRPEIQPNMTAGIAGALANGQKDTPDSGRQEHGPIARKI